MAEENKTVEDEIKFEDPAMQTRFEELQKIAAEYAPDKPLLYEHMAQYKTPDSMTINFFYSLAVMYGDKAVRAFIAGEDADKNHRYPFIGAGSHLANQAYLWSLAYLYAAKHGYVFNNLNSDVYNESYASLFSWVFNEYDDTVRNRVSRENLYSELTRWDARVDSGYKNFKSREVSFSDKDKKAEEEIYAQRQKYPFSGPLGHFINVFGYISPDMDLPIYKEIKQSYLKEGEDKRSLKRINLDSLYYRVMAKVLQVIYLDKIESPDFSGIKFLTADKDNGALIIKDERALASDEEIMEDLDKITERFKLPKIDFDELFKHIEERQAIVDAAAAKQKEENDNANS